MKVLIKTKEGLWCKYSINPKNFDSSKMKLIDEVKNGFPKTRI